MVGLREKPPNNPQAEHSLSYMAKTHSGEVTKPLIALNEPRHEKTRFLPMLKQRRRSAVRLPQS